MKINLVVRLSDQFTYLRGWQNHHRIAAKFGQYEGNVVF
jgi:hypothetical protein